MATFASDYDISRFGAEAIRFSPRQSDMLIVAGIINTKMAPVLKTVYDQMADPKWVMSMGACASSGGIFNVYSVLQGIDNMIPVDVYVPGCPPAPEGVMHAIAGCGFKMDRGRYPFADVLAGPAGGAQGGVARDRWYRGAQARWARG